MVRDEFLNASTKTGLRKSLQRIMMPPRLSGGEKKHFVPGMLSAGTCWCLVSVSTRMSS